MVKITRQEFEKAHEDLGYAIDILNVLCRAEVDLHDNEKTAFSKILADLIEPAETVLDGLNCGHSIEPEKENT